MSRPGLVGVTRSSSSQRFSNTFVISRAALERQPIFRLGAQDKRNLRNYENSLVVVKQDQAPSLQDQEISVAQAAVVISHYAQSLVNIGQSPLQIAIQVSRS